MTFLRLPRTYLDQGDNWPYFFSPVLLHQYLGEEVDYQHCGLLRSQMAYSD